MNGRCCDLVNELIHTPSTPRYSSPLLQCAMEGGWGGRGCGRIHLSVFVSSSSTSFPSSLKRTCSHFIQPACEKQPHYPHPSLPALLSCTAWKRWRMVPRDHEQTLHIYSTVRVPLILHKSSNTTFTFCAILQSLGLIIQI